METSIENVGAGAKNHPHPRPHKFEVIVIYNGIKKPLELTIDELMKTVLGQAIALFGSLPNPHTLALFSEAGRELPATGTVQEAGIKPGEKLLLRPSAVRGG
jgi:hypothetical protein